MKEKIKIVNGKIEFTNLLLGGSITNSFNDLIVDEDNTVESLDLLNYFNATSFTATSSSTDLVNVSINNTNLDINLVQNAYSNAANSLNQGELLSFTIPNDYQSELKYFCYSHSSMIANFTIEDAPVDTTSINTKFYVRLNSDPFSSPYYIFSSTENGTSLDVVLYRGISYEFERTDSGHPFNIGSNHNENTTGIVITSNGTGGTVYSEALITVSATDGSSTVDQSFKIKVNPISDETTGTVIFTDNVLVNQTITATVNLTDNDGSLTLGYQWQVSDDNSTFTNISGLESQGLSFVIPSDYVGKYIRLQVSSVDNDDMISQTIVNGDFETNDTLVNGSYNYDTPHGWTKIQTNSTGAVVQTKGINTSWLGENNTDNNIMIGFRNGIKLYQEITGYTGFYTLTFDLIKRTHYFPNYISNINVLINNEVKLDEQVSNETIEQRTITWFNTEDTIRIEFANPETDDTSQGAFFIDNVVVNYISSEISTINSYSREVKDVFGDIQVNTSSDNTVIKLENTYTDTSFDGESSLYYSNFASTNTDIVPTLSSTWDQIGSSIYGEGFRDKSGSAVSLSNDGTIIAIGEYNEFYDNSSDNLGSVRVFELINNVWTQKGSKLIGEQEIDWFGLFVKLSGDGTKLFVSAPKYNVNTLSVAGKLYIYTFTNNDWLNVNTIEGDTDQHSMLFDASEDGTVFAIRSRNQNKVTVYNYDYSTDVYSVKGSVLTGTNNFGNNISLSGDGNSILITNDIGYYYVYTYDNDWVQKGSIVYSDQNKGNSSLKLNYYGSAFIYGSNTYNNLFVKTISVGADVASVLTNFEDEGYSLYTAYYGNNDGTNLSNGTKYETLNSSKLLNIYDYNKVRYDVHSPEGTYQTTSYSNDIFKFDFNIGETSHELNDITGYSTNVYIKISGFFAPQTTGNYRLVFNPIDDGVRIRMREFTTSTDIENDSNSLIPLMRSKTDVTNYFKYAVYNFTENYDSPFIFSNYKKILNSSTMLEWNSDNNVNADMNTFSITSSGTETVNIDDYNTLADSDSSQIFIKMEVVFSTSTDDEYYFEFFTDDGIRIKIVEFNETAPNSNTTSDWDSLNNIDTSGDYDYETNWEGHPPCVFQYTISLEKHKIYKAYVEYTQGTGGYTFSHRIHRSGDSTYRKFEDTFQLYDSDAIWDGDANGGDHFWTDRDSYSAGGSIFVDIGNIYLDNTKNYEFLIEYSQGGGGGRFNFYAENTDENFTSSPYSISSEFVSLVNLKSRLEVLKEDPNNQISSNSSDFNFYDPNVGVDKYTYLVFYKEGDANGKSKVYEYKTDIGGTTDWYQIGNDILGLSSGGFGGWRSTLDKSGRQIATTDVRHDGGTVRLLKYDPIGTSIANLYGSGINAPNTILANNEKLYQGSYITSPNQKYILAFPEWYGILELRYNPNPEDTNIDIESETDFNNLERLYFINYDIHAGNRDMAYIVMEDGNLNAYNLFGEQRHSFRSDSTSGVLALDNNGNLSIVENWFEWKRFSGGGEQGIGIDFSTDGSVIAIGTKNFDNTLYQQGRVEVFGLNNELTLANVNSLTVDSSTDISFNITNGTLIDSKTFTVSNIDDPTFGELRIISNTTNLYEGGTLTADTSSITDPDGTINFTYEWEISNSSDFIEFSPITSSTNSSFTIPKDSESSFSYVGQYIRLKVYDDNNTEYISDPRLVLNIEDEATGTVSFTSDFNLILEESLLTAVISITDIDNNRLITDTNNVGSLTLSYQWQISDDNNTFTNIDTDGTASTYKIPLGVYDKYIRLSVTTTDIRGGTTDFLSSSSLIEKLNLVTQTSISDSNYLEGNNYVFDLSSIIFNNFDVSFSIKTDDVNGSSTINNNLLTFTPNNNDYYGESTVVVTASSPSITTITQDITFTIDIQPVDDKPSGTVIFTDNVLVNQTITASVNLTDNDGSLTLGYQWQVSDDNSTFTNISGLDSQGLSFVIPSDYVGKYIRLQVSSIEDEMINNDDMISQTIVNSDFETGVIMEEGTWEDDVTPTGWTENGSTGTNRIIIHGKEDNWIGDNNTDDNTMIGLRRSRRLYQEITGYTGFYTLTFDLIKRTISDRVDIPNINVLINNEVKLDEQVSNETIEQRTVTWFNTEDTIRIEFASTDPYPEDKTFFIDNVAVSYISSGFSTINSYSRQVNDSFGDIQVNTSSDDTVIKLENTYTSLYNSYNAKHHSSAGDFENLFGVLNNDNENFYNDIKDLNNHYITIPDFSGDDTFYTFDASANTSWISLRLRDKYGNKPILDTDTYYTFNVYSFIGNSSLEYSNVRSYKSYYAKHHKSDIPVHDTLMFYDNEGQDLYNYTSNLSNHYITIPDFSGDTVYTFNVFIYGDGTYYGLSLRDPDGNRPSLTTDTYYTFNVYPNVSDSNIAPTITSTWEQIGDAFYGTNVNDYVANYLSLSNDGTVVAFSKGSNSIEVYEKINENWTQRGSTIDLVNSFNYIQISEDGTKLLAHIYDYDTNYNNKVVLYKYNNSSWEKLVAEYQWSSTYLMSFTSSKDCKLFAIGFRAEKYVEVWKLDDDENGFTQYGNTITEDIYRFGAGVKLSENGEMICIQNPFSQFVTEVDTNLIGAGFMDVYYYNNGTWTKKGSRIYQEKSMNTVHGYNFDFNVVGNTFSFGNYFSDNYILKMINEGGNASTIISEYENAGYSLYTAYYGTSLDSENLLNGTIYDSLNDGKLLNINDHNRVRYDIYTVSRVNNNWDFTSPVYQKTEYRNELLSWSGAIGDSETSNLEVLTGTLGDEGIYIVMSFFISPVTSDDYKFKFLNNDDGAKFYIVEFGNDIDSGEQTISSFLITDTPIYLDSSKNYEIKMIWWHGHGAFVFQPQVDIGNNGTFVDLYNTNNFTFKSRFEVLKEENTSFTSSQDNYNIDDPHSGIQKFTYYVFKSDNAGSTYIYQYDDTLNDWYQLGNTIYNSPSSLQPEDDKSGNVVRINETGKVVAITETGYENGNVKVMHYNPYGTSIANLYGSGINAPNTILANNQKLYQGSYITSPNQKYVLMFQVWNGDISLRYNPDPENTSIETDFLNLDELYNDSPDVHNNNTDAYLVMEFGNLNVYNLSGEHRYSYTTNSKSGVLSLDDNGNLSIVENWTQKGNNITGFRSGDENGRYLDISNDGLTLAVGTRYYDGVNNDISNSGLLRIYNIDNQLTLANVNSLDIGSSTNISFDVTDGNVYETKTFTVSNIDDTIFGEIRILSNTINLYEGGTLTADTSSLTDPDGTINLTYQWEISPDSSTYTSITDATNSTFTIPRDTESSFSYVGQYIRLKVVANGTDFYSDPKLVLNIEDEATGTLSFTSNLILIQEGAILTAVTNLSDVDNNKLISNNSEGTLTLAYQWQVSQDNTSFTNISGATSNEYQIPLDTYTGQYIRLFITTTDTRSGTTDFVTTSSLIEVNSSPFFNTSPITTAYVGILYSYSFTFSDADENQTISITNISYPNWITFDANNNTLSGTPTENDINDKDVSITISDGTNETIQSFSIYVNRAPYVGTDLNLTFDEDEVINPIDLDLYFSDYDNDTLNYTIDSYDTNLFAASIDSDRKLNLVLVANNFGTSDITITATDGHNSITHTGTIIINSVNDDPTGTVTIVGTTLPNKELSVDFTQITDIENDPLTYTYLWQMSSDSDFWDSSTNVGTSSTYTIPDTNDNENKYIRVIVTIEDSDTNNNDFVSNVVQIQKIDLITSFSESNTINEDNDYTFDLSSIINTDYDVSFEVKTDDANGTSVIDINKLLTFTPNTNYNGSSTVIVTASTDSSVTSITQDITFNITVNPINDQPTGTITITGVTLPNNELSVDLTQITDVENDTLTYSFLWQMSSDTNLWDSSSDVATSSTYTIPDTNDNENKYIRVKVNVKDSDDINTEFISDEVQIQKLDLVTSFTINESIDEDNDYTFDLSSIINNNYDVSFEVKTDDSNGTSVIDINKLLTFTPDQHYYGGSTITVTASTDTSVTSITQDLTFNITVISVNDEPTGTVLIEGNALLNDTLSAILDISDIENDVLEYSYSWEISNDENNWNNSIVVGTESSYTIAENNDFIGQYIRLVLSIKDSDTNDNKIISSNTLEISNIRLVESDAINETIQEDNNYVYDLNTIKNQNHNVYFAVNNVLNGQASIDENHILTFIPDENYFGSATILLDVTTDPSITTMVQSLLFNLNVVSVNDDPTGTVTIVGTTLPNKELSVDLTQITDIENDALTYNLLWQMSSDNNVWEDLDTSSTYTIPDTNDNENKYIRVIVTIQDSDTNNNEIISNVIQIQKLDLITSFSESNTINEDNDYIFDLSSIINTDYDVSFDVKTDDANGTSVIDINKLLTFTPDTNYNGSSTVIVTASTDSSVTSITQDITFNITINPINDQPTGTISITGVTLPNKELSVDLTQITDIENDTLTYSFLWQMSSNTNVWENDVATSSTYIIPDTNDNENKYIRVKVYVKDSDDINTEFISDEVQIQKLDLITSFTINDTINEDNDYTFDLSSIINNNYDVSFEVKTDDSNGTSVIDINKLLTFTPNQHYYGQSMITITASIETSITSITQDITFNITINSVNDRPIFNNGSFSTDEDVSTTFDLSSLTSDVENDSLTYTIITEPSKGSASIEGSILTFVPTENLNGSDSIEVNVSDGELSSTSTISITINSINDAPVFIDGSFTTNEDTEATYDLSVLASDVDSNSLTYSIVTEPNKGNASIQGSILTYNPELNYSGSDSIEVSVSDGILSSTNTISIIVNPINDTPIFNNGSFSTDEDTPKSFDLSSLASDAENDLLTYTIVSEATKGTSIITGSTLLYSPFSNLNGSDSVQIGVSDGNTSTTGTISITINPVNDAPKIDNGSFSVNEAIAKEFDLLTLNASDVDSNNLTYAVKTLPSKGDVSINNTTLTYKSYENEYGADSFVITVSDGELFTESTIDVLINATPKILNNFDDLRIEENSDDYIVDLYDKFIDADDNELTYSVISNNTNLVNASIITSNNLQLGDNIINGRNSDLNSDGKKLIYYDTNDKVIKILKYENENWIQMGSNIDSNTYYFSISHIGNRIAIGERNLGTIKIYDYTNDWNEIRQIDNVEFTGKISFSPDDNWILVGNNNYNNYTGNLIVYNIDLNFTMGNNSMTGDNSYSFWGQFYDISNSNIGDYTIAGGAYGESGLVKIFYYDQNDELFYQMGSNLNNENTYDGFGYSVSLSNDGSIIAIGAPGDSDELSINDPLTKGYVKIYEYINNEWSLKGQKLEGENSGDFFGNIVKLSSDGLKLAVTLNNQVNIYEFVNDTWIKINFVYYENISNISLSENADILNASTNSEIKTFSLSVSDSPRLKLSLTPNSKGETTIDVSASDNEVSITNSFNVIVFRENELPVFDSAPVTIAYEDLLYEYNVQVSDVNVEDSSLTIEVIEKPDWLTFNNNEYNRALLSGTPLVDHIGNHNVVLKVTDTVLESATQSFTITVIEVNDNPTFVSQPITEVDERSEYVYNIVVNDEENDNVSITVDSALIPSWLTLTQIDNNNAVLNGTPDKFDAGDYNIIITATDEHGKSNSQVFTLTVNNVNFLPVITSTPDLFTLTNNLYTYTVVVDHDGEVNFKGTKVPYWATFTDNNDNTATLTGIPDIHKTFTVNIVVKEVNGLKRVINQNFSIKVDAEPYVKNPIKDISIVTFDKFEYKLPEFNNSKYTNENTVSIKKSSPVRSDHWIFYDVSYNTDNGDSLSYELFIDNRPVDTYNWITFTNGLIKINPKYHHIGIYTFKIKVTDIMGNNAETEFNVKINSSVIKFEKQFYNNNREALVELDSTNFTDALNKTHNYLDTHNLSHEKYNVIIFNTDKNKVQIYEGDNNNHTITDHDFIDTYVIAKYLDNIRRTKQSIVITPNKNLNIELL